MPSKFPKGDNGIIAGDRESIANFWDRANNEAEEGLSDSVGCYIFSIRAGKGSLPWYVGMAEKQSFKK